MNNIVAFNPCFVCPKDGKCSMCELNMYRQGTLSNPQWISIDERSPECGTYFVVVKCKYAWETEWEIHTDVAFLNEDEEWETFNDWDEGNEVVITHWMPLPEAPNMKGGE